MIGRCIALFVLAGLAGGAEAGVVISTQEHAAGATPAPMIRGRQAFLDTDRLKIADARGGIIYRGDLGKVWIYDDERKSYLELERSTAPKRQGVAAIAYDKSGAPRRVGKWPCEGLTRLEGGQRSAELCFARLADLGLKPEDLVARQGMASLMEGAIGREWSGVDGWNLMGMALAAGFPGLPVQVTEQLPRGTLETTVTAIERKPLAPAIFELPANYTRQDMPQPQPPKPTPR